MPYLSKDSKMIVIAYICLKNPFTIPLCRTVFLVPYTATLSIRFGGLLLGNWRKGEPLIDMPPHLPSSLSLLS